MAPRLIYLLFCQVVRWFALLARSSAAKDAELSSGAVERRARPNHRHQQEADARQRGSTRRRHLGPIWGLFPLVRNDVRLTGGNWMQKAMSLLHRGGTERLRLSQMNFAGAGPAMMRKLARDHQVASPQELLELARDMGVRLIPCQMTMDLLGLTRQDMIDGLVEPAGVRPAPPATLGG
jgi:peroxiredoxin family protein